MQKMRNFIDILQESIRTNWEANALSDLGGETFKFRQIAEEVKHLHHIFENAGLKAGDRVALCAKNSSHWAISFPAVETYHAVAVPLLNDFLPESVMKLVDHSESKMFFTERSIWENLDPAKMPGLSVAIDVDDFSLLMGDACITDIPSEMSRKPMEPADVHYETGSLDDLALINYTSGTTSAPKGVMLTFRNISSNIEFALSHIPNGPGDEMISMLPLAHMYGLAFEFIYPVAGGCHVHFLGKTPSPKVLLGAMASVHPYLLITVPLVLEKIFRNAVFPTLNKPAIKRLMRIPFFDAFMKKTIRKKLMKTFGGKVRSIIVGGAAINNDVEMCMKSIGLPYLVGYGMTECAPLLSYEGWDKFVAKSCGKAVDGMELRIDSSDPQHIPGEILAKGVNVMSGYYKDPEATAAAIDMNGWLHTGDMGVIDARGNVFIKGRCKNLIVGANGQNIYPEEIEDKLNSLPLVAESIVVERNNQLVALIFPVLEKGRKALSPEAIAAKMEENRLRLNEMLPAYSRVAKVEIRDTEFEKTPKRSIKRFLYK